jgi:hypothetical protein
MLGFFGPAGTSPSPAQAQVRVGGSSTQQSGADKQSAPSSHSRVEPSMSVKRKVTVPVGAGAVPQ